MIGIRTKDGIELEIEASNDPKRVERLLSYALRPETYARLKREAIKAEEIFFEFTGAVTEELPRIRHHLVHLDSRPRGSVNLSTGDFILIFCVHQDHLSVAQEMATEIKSAFKTANDWKGTTRHGIEAEDFFQIPGAKLPGGAGPSQ
jgi:hypothetical protein